MRKFTAWILMGIVMFSFIRLLLIINNNFVSQNYVFIDFVCIIILSLIILYIETPFFENKEVKQEAMQFKARHSSQA